MKTVFTTGEAAKICNLSQQTIIRCFDSGQLKGFRVPGSRFRRIPRADLLVFMRDNGIPTEALESAKRRVLIVDDDEELVQLITDALDRDGRFETRNVNNGFDAGMMAREHWPDLVVLDVLLPDTSGKEVCQGLRSDKSMEDLRIICVSPMMEQDAVSELKKAGADDFMDKPFLVEDLVERICHHLDIQVAPSQPSSAGVEVYIDPGDASTETIQALLETLSDLHRAAGGLGLEFKNAGLYVLASTKVRT